MRSLRPETEADGVAFPQTRKGEYFRKYLLPIMLWMLLIFTSSSIPSVTFPKVSFWGWAKLVHLFYYIVLCFLVQRALRRQTRFPKLAMHSYLYGILVAVVYGATDEYHQLLTPGRHGAISDVFIDGLGAFLYFVFVKVSRYLKPQSGPPALQ